MENYMNNFKIKTILTALYQDLESNRKMINMLWQELDKPVKPTKPTKLEKKPANAKRRVNSSTNPTLQVLQSKAYPVSANHIAKKTGMNIKAVQHNIWRLRCYGFNIETSYAKSRKAKYHLRRAG